MAQMSVLLAKAQAHRPSPAAPRYFAAALALAVADVVVRTSYHLRADTAVDVVVVPGSVTIFLSLQNLRTWASQS